MRQDTIASNNNNNNSNINSNNVRENGDGGDDNDIMKLMNNKKEIRADQISNKISAKPAAAAAEIVGAKN